MFEDNQNQIQSSPEAICTYRLRSATKSEKRRRDRELTSNYMKSPLFTPMKGFYDRHNEEFKSPPTSEKKYNKANNPYIFDEFDYCLINDHDSPGFIYINNDNDNEVLKFEKFKQGDQYHSHHNRHYLHELTENSTCKEGAFYVENNSPPKQVNNCSNCNCSAGNCNSNSSVNPGYNGNRNLIQNLGLVGNSYNRDIGHNNSREYRKGDKRG